VAPSLYLKVMVKVHLSLFTPHRCVLWRGSVVPRILKNVSDDVHSPATLPPEEQYLLPADEGSGCAPASVWRRETLPAPVGNRNAILLFSSQWHSHCKVVDV
jgi:hypothetical protein